MPIELDPRIAPIFQNERPAIRLIALAVFSQVSGRELDRIIGQFGEKSIDWTEIVDGRPLLHYNGKTRQQLEREGLHPDTIAKVEDALDRRGLTLVNDQPPPPREVGEVRAGDGSVREGDVVRDPTLADKSIDKSIDTSGQERTGQPPPGQPNAQTGQEPVIVGHPLSQLRGKSDQQLLAMQNIAPTTIPLIRQAEKDHPVQQAQARTNAPPPAAVGNIPPKAGQQVKK
jgi:hypothetical protein